MRSFSAKFHCWLYLILALLQIATRETGNQYGLEHVLMLYKTNSEFKINIIFMIYFGFHLLFLA